MLEIRDIVNFVRDHDIHVFQLIMSRDFGAREGFRRHRRYLFNKYFACRVKIKVPGELDLEIETEMALGR
jgi:hypothetical protein